MNAPQADTIFSPIFGKDWDNLPPALQAHYAIRPFSRDLVRVKGELNVTCAGYFKWFPWLIKLSKTVPPFAEDNVATTVDFSGDPTSNALHFSRCFAFKKHGPWHFNSRLIPYKGDQVIEHMAWRLCWHCRFHWADKRIKIQHLGYRFFLFGRYFPMPVAWLIGKGKGVETAVDENHFTTTVTITHPVWGKVYGYRGQFKIMRLSGQEHAPRMPAD